MADSDQTSRRKTCRRIEGSAIAISLPFSDVIFKMEVGLGWVGLGWVGLGWVGLGWVGLGWVGLGWDVVVRVG